MDELDGAPQGTLGADLYSSGICACPEGNKTLVKGWM
jgi:hypothetical protein